MAATLSDLPFDDNKEQEIPELKVENICVVEDVLKENKEVTDAEGVELIYKPPRFFRRSLIHKTLKFFEKKEKNEKSKLKRPLRQK
jgi:hypothetical protein